MSKWLRLIWWILGKIEVSISKVIAPLFELNSRQPVIVEKVLPQNVEIDFIQLICKDQYMDRNDMWRLKLSLIGTCVFVGKKLLLASIKGGVGVQDLEVSSNALMIW